MVSRAPHRPSPLTLALKRTLDLLVATVIGLTLLPLLVAAVVALQLASPGPVLFAQQRVGRGGRPFRMYKLRSMHVGADEALSTLVAGSEELRGEWGRYGRLARDPRVVPGIGTLVRRTSVDELPQIWNVLRGDMSLVGPRPLQPALLDALPAGLVRCRMAVRPGLTGLWQVSGRSELSLEDMLAMDAVYVRGWTMRQDLRILSRTPGAVLRRRGAY